MLLQKKKRYLASVIIFLFLLIGTGAGFFLLKNSQDVRQQASGGCKPGEPYCSCDLNGQQCQLIDPDGLRAIVEQGSSENLKGVLATSFTGERPTTSSACGGVWMNNFCYMPGDEIAGGFVVVESGRYNYPYLEKKATHDSLAFGAETVTNQIGTVESLGKDCGGNGHLIGNNCYAFGAVVNGYLVMPNRTSGCDNSTGDYCYPHLKKIDVSYNDWQAAIDQYEKTGDSTKLEQLYKNTYGISFQPGGLFDPKASNADLLKAQALIASLTNAEVLKENAKQENLALLKDSGGNLTAEQQATYDFNRQIIESENLDKQYQLLDQLNNATSQKLTVNGAISNMYSDLVVADSGANLDNLAREKFKEIFGYDPGSKYGDLNGILGAFGIDPTQLNADRSNYKTAVAAAAEEQKQAVAAAAEEQKQAVAEQNQNVDKLNQEYQDYVSGESESINDLKQAALDAGLVTNNQIRNLSETDLLALLLSKFSDTSTAQATQNATAIVNSRAEQELTTKYMDNRGKNTSSEDLLALYKLYVGSSPRYRMTTQELEKEIAKHNSQLALSLYAETQDVSYLNNYYTSNFNAPATQLTRVLGDPKALLNSIYGDYGTEFYQKNILPSRFDEAMTNFSSDSGASLTSVCKDLGVTNCNINDQNATATLSLMLDKMYGDQEGVSIPELATNYSSQIFADSKDAVIEAKFDLMGSGVGYAQTSGGFFIGEKLANWIMGTDKPTTAELFMESHDEAGQTLIVARQAVDTFNASQAFNYATKNKAALSDYTFGTAMGNAFMLDNLANRNYNIKTDLGLTGWDRFSMGWNQVETQFFGVDNVGNIADNYAKAVSQNYTGPVNTNVADLAMQAASNLKIADVKNPGTYVTAIDNYTAAESGYYFSQWANNVGATLADWATTAGTYISLSNQNATPSYYGATVGQEILSHQEIVDQATNAGNEVKANIQERFYTNQASNYIDESKLEGVNNPDLRQALINEQVQGFVAFQTDEGIIRSRQELNWETVEKVVAPTAAIIVLPVAIASGAGLGVVAGLASSTFSLYQGAGMKAQALDAQTTAISRYGYEDGVNVAAQNLANNPVVNKETGEVIEYTYDEALELVETQNKMLNQQANMMLASAAVGALTSGAGVINGFVSGAQSASQLAISTAKIMGTAGRLGGIGLSAANVVNSSQTLFDEDASAAEKRMSGLSAFVAASGIVGNSFGFINNPTGVVQSITTKTDLALDILNIPAGVGVDMQQVSRACYDDDYPGDASACRNAWIGLALSLTQDMVQVGNSVSSYNNYRASYKATDAIQRINSVDTEINKILGNTNRSIGENLKLGELQLYRESLVAGALAVNPNLKIPEVPVTTLLKTNVSQIRTEDLMQTAAQNRSNLLSRAAELEQSNPDLAVQLRQQADDIFNRQLEISSLGDEIRAIDRAIDQDFDKISTERIEELREMRSNLVAELDNKANDPAYQAHNLSVENKQLAISLRENEVFKAYDEFRSLEQEQIRIQEQNIPPPIENLTKQTGLAAILPKVAEQNKALDLIEAQNRVLEIQRLSLEKNQLERAVETEDSLLRIEEINKQIADANTEFNRITESAEEQGFWQRVKNILPGSKTEKNYAEAILALKDINQYNQDNARLEELSDKHLSKNLTSEERQEFNRLLDDLEGADQRYGQSQEKISQALAGVTESLQNSQGSFGAIAFINRATEGIKNIFSPSSSKKQYNLQTELKDSKVDLDLLGQHEKLTSDLSVYKEGLAKAQEAISQVPEEQRSILQQDIDAYSQKIEIAQKKLTRIEGSVDIAETRTKYFQAIIDGEQQRVLEAAFDSQDLTAFRQEVENVKNAALDRLELSSAERVLFEQLVSSKEIINSSKSRTIEEVSQARKKYAESLTKLSQRILGDSPDLEAYQRLGEIQRIIKQTDLLGTVRENSDIGKVLASQEIRLNTDDPLVAVKMANIVREMELRTGATEGVPFFNSRTNQVDTMLKILSGDRVAVELTTAGGKTFVGAAVLKIRQEIIGYETGIYIAKPGQEADIQKSMAIAYGVDLNKIPILDNSRLSDSNYVESLREAAFIIADPAQIQFIRNTALNFKDPSFKIAVEIYSKLTKDASIYVDELQITLDPNRQAINSVGPSTQDIPQRYKDAASLIGQALDQTVLKDGGWGLGDNPFLVLRTQDGAEIAKFSKSAQEEIFTRLAEETVISSQKYGVIAENATEIERALNQGEDVLAAKLTELGVADVETTKVSQVLDQIDMLNSFAQGLKMQRGTDYIRAVDSVLSKNGGPNRNVTIPASGGVSNEGQSYKANLQVAMEYIGARAYGDDTNFSGLKSSPNEAFRSNISSYFASLKNSSVGAVTGAMADGAGVAEVSFGLTTYRSTEAVDKIVGIEGVASGGRVVAERSFAIGRGQDVDAVVALKNSHKLDMSDGRTSNGNLKIVMGTDGAEDPLKFALSLAETDAFKDSEFAIQNPDGTYSRVSIKNGQISSEPVTTKQIQDLYERGAQNLITIIGRGGATGDSIKTAGNVPGITITSSRTPVGLVAQAGARIDRGSDIADQYALIISPGASRVNIDKPMTTTDFSQFKNEIIHNQKIVEQAKNTQALDQGVTTASNRVLESLIFESSNEKIQEWASNLLLKFSTEGEQRDLDLNGGSQTSLIARQKKVEAEIIKWQEVLADPTNASILRQISSENPELYKTVLTNAGVNSKLAYAGAGAQASTTKESVITADNLEDFVRRHNLFVTADSESKFVASSGRQVETEQIAVKNQQNSNESVRVEAELNLVKDTIRDLAAVVSNPIKMAAELGNGTVVKEVLKAPARIIDYAKNLDAIQENAISNYRVQRESLANLVASLEAETDVNLKTDLQQQIDNLKKEIAAVPLLTKASNFINENITGGVRERVASTFSFFTNLFSKKEISPEILAQRNKAISDLKITDKQELADLENLKTEEEVANFVAERQAAYQKLKDQFAALNTVRPAINNEEDYQAQSQKLAETLKTIQDLQNKSGLAFLEIAEDGAIQRVNKDQFNNLSTFRAKAEVQAEKLAKVAELKKIEDEKLAEEAKKAEEARQLADAEKARIEQEEKEAKLLAEQKQKEDDQKAIEEANRLEQEQLAEEAKNKAKAEEAEKTKQAKEQAALELAKAREAEELAIANEVQKVQEVQKAQESVNTADENQFDIKKVTSFFAVQFNALKDKLSNLFNQNNAKVIETIGRNTNSSLKVNAGLVPVSRNHAELIKNNNLLYIRDLKSTNGTYVNGNKIDSNTNFLLNENDIVFLGNPDYTGITFTVAKNNKDQLYLKTNSPELLVADNFIFNKANPVEERSPNLSKEDTILEKLKTRSAVLNLDQSELNFFNQAKKDSKQSKLVRDLLNKKEFVPKRKVIIEGITYYFLTDIVKTNNGSGYLQVLMYSIDSNNRIIPRSLYKSNSDGGWRSAPYSVNGIHSKGNGVVYTQETKVHDQLNSLFNEIEDNGSVIFMSEDLIEDYFNVGVVIDNNLYNFADEVKIYDDKGLLSNLQKYPPGSYNEEEFAPKTEDIRNLDYPDGFIPDFNKGPILTEEVNHTLLGATTLRKYLGILNNRPVVWVMATDKSDRVWIDRIYFADSQLTSYGVYDEVINSGILTNKPLEYISQSYYLDKNHVKAYNDKYVDITPMLANLLPIQQYRNALQQPQQNKYQELVDKIAVFADNFEIKTEEEYDLAINQYNKVLSLTLELQKNSGVVFIEENNGVFQRSADWIGKDYEEFFAYAVKELTSHLLDQSKYRGNINFEITFEPNEIETFVEDGFNAFKTTIQEQIRQKENFYLAGGVISQANDFMNSFSRLQSLSQLLNIPINQISDNLHKASLLIDILQEQNLEAHDLYGQIQQAIQTLNSLLSIKDLNKGLTKETELSLAKLASIAQARGLNLKDPNELRKFYEVLLERPNFELEIANIVRVAESDKTNFRENLESIASSTEAVQEAVPVELFEGSDGYKLISQSKDTNNDSAINFYKSLRSNVFSLILSEEGLAFNEDNTKQYLEKIASLNNWTEYIKDHFQTTLDENERQNVIALVNKAFVEDLLWIRKEKFDEILFSSLFIDKPFFDGLLLTGNTNVANAYDTFGQSTRTGDVGAWDSWVNAYDYNLSEFNLENLRSLHKTIFAWYDDQDTNPYKKNDRAGVLRDPNDPRDKEPLYAKDYQDGSPLVLTQSQIDSLNSLRTLRDGVDEPIMKFVYAEGISSPNENGLYVGYIEFCKAADVEQELEALMKWHTEEMSKPHDPYLLAAELQQRFIAIHPFRDGNGRTSRWLMNWSLKKDGVESSIIYDTDGDMFTSVQDWAEELRKGEVRFKSLKNQVISMIERGIPSEMIIPQIEVEGTENWDFNQWTQFLTFVRNNPELSINKLAIGKKLNRNEFYSAIKEAVVSFYLYQITTVKPDFGGLIDPYYAMSYTNTNPRVQEFLRKNYTSGEFVRRGVYNKLDLANRFTKPEDLLSFFHGGQDDLITTNGVHRAVTTRLYEEIKDKKTSEQRLIISNYLSGQVVSHKDGTSGSKFYQDFPDLVVNSSITNEFIDEIIKVLIDNKGLKVPGYFAKHAAEIYNYIMLDIFNNRESSVTKQVVGGHINGGGWWNVSPFTSYSKNLATPQNFSVRHLSDGNVNAAFVVTSALPTVGALYDMDYDGVYSFQRAGIRSGFNHEAEVLFAGGQNLSLIEKIEMWVKDSSDKVAYLTSTVERFGVDGNFLRLIIYDKNGSVLNSEIHKFDENGFLNLVDVIKGDELNKFVNSHSEISEVRSLISQLNSGDSQAKFDTYTGQSLTIPIVIGENGYNVVDASKFQEFKNKLQLIIKYKNYLNRAYVNLGDNPSFAEAEKRFKEALEKAGIKYEPLDLSSDVQSNSPRKSFELITDLENGIKNGDWVEELFSDTSSHPIRKFRNTNSGLTVLAKKAPGHTIRTDFISTLILNSSGLPSPKVEIVKLNGDEYLVSEFIDNAKSGSSNKFPANFTDYRLVQKAFLFDLLTMNYDRNAENILFSENGKEVFFIDNAAGLGSSARGEYRDFPDELTEDQIAQIMTLALNDNLVVNPAYAEIIDFEILKKEGRVVLKNVELMKELLSDFAKLSNDTLSETVEKAFSNKAHEEMIKEILERRLFVENYLAANPNSRYAPATIKYFNKILNEFNGNEENYLSHALQARRNSIINYFSQMLQQSENSFNSLCSDCNQVREETKVGMQAVDALLTQSELKLTQANQTRASIENTPDQASQLEAEAKVLEKEAATLQKQALDKIDETRTEVVNTHGMQNQCVQLYLNAWVNTREAEIKQTRNSTNKAIDSIYDATLIAEELLASSEMEIIEQKGFLGIGKKTAQIALSTEDISDIKQILDNPDSAQPGLKQMAEFEREKDGSLNKATISRSAANLNLEKNTGVKKVLNLGAANFLITKFGIGINRLPVGQIIEDRDLFYKVTKRNGKNILVNVLPFRQNLSTFEKTVDKYNKEKNPEQITLANNLKIDVYWNEEETSVFAKTNNSDQGFELNENGLIFDNGVILRIVDNNQLDVEWLTEEIKIASSQSLIIKDGKIYFSNKKYKRSNDEEILLGFQINGRFYGDHAGQIELKVGDEIVSYIGQSYVLNKDEKGFYSLDKIEGYEKGEAAIADLLDKIKSLNGSASLRMDFLSFLNKELQLGKSDEKILLLSNDDEAYFEYVNDIFGLSKWSGLQNISSVKIYQNPKEFNLAETKLVYMVFKFYDIDDEFIEIRRNIEKIAIETLLPILKYSANSLRYQAELPSGVEQFSLITYLKNLEELIKVYESYLNEPRSETELKVNKLIGLFENSFGEKIDQELEKDRQFTPYDHSTYIENTYTFPFSNKLELEKKLDLINDNLQEFLTKRLFEQITDETGQDAFTAHQVKAPAFWDLYFSEMGIQKPEWFKPGVYGDKENYGYLWQHYHSERTIANAAGNFYLKRTLSLDSDSLEKTIDHESIHNTFVPESALRKSKDGFDHEEIVTELLAQMMYLQTTDLPSRDFGSGGYQTGVRELIDILNEINEKSGEKLGQKLLLKGIVDYGENKIAHPLVYVAKQYDSYINADNSDFYQRLTPYTNDLMRGNHDNLPEESFVIGRLN